jgi:hypothetical protein
MVWPGGSQKEIPARIEVGQHFWSATMKRYLALFLFSAAIPPITHGSETRLKSIAVDEQTGTRLSIIDESRGPAGTDPCTGGYGNLQVIGEVPANISLENESDVRALAERAKATAMTECPRFVLSAGFGKTLTLLLLKGIYSTTTNYGDPNYVNFRQMLVQAPWEVYSVWTQSSSRQPVQYKDYNAAAARAALAKEVVRPISNSEFLFLLGADTKTNVRFWIYSKNRNQKCWAYSGGARDLVGEVPDGVSLLDQDLVRSLLMTGTQLGIDKCGGFTESKLFLAPTSWKAGNNYSHIQPIRVEGIFYGSQSQKPLEIKNYVVQAELERIAKSAEEKKRIEAGSRFDQFVRKYGVAKSPTMQELTTNPFVYEGVIVAMKSTFEEMMSATQGVFGSAGRSFVVSGIPRGAFTEKAAVLLAGRVLGKTELKTGLGSLIVPHLAFVGVFRCTDWACSDITTK